MQENNTITKEQYIIKKLSAEIATLKEQLAESEFAILLLRQEIENLKSQNESEEESETEVK